MKKMNPQNKICNENVNLIGLFKNFKKINLNDVMKTVGRAKIP